MGRKSRIPKSSAQRLNECETHLYFLWNTRRLYLLQRERYKQIAAELRVLVCQTRHNKPLLLDLTDEYGFSYEVQPPGSQKGGPPLKPQPVPMVGWRDDPLQRKLSDELNQAVRNGDEKQIPAIEKKLEELAKPVPFRDWVNNGLAIYIKPYDYSNRELTLAIAQQFGSSHEDDSVEEPIVRLQNVLIGGESSEIATLIKFAGTVIVVGEMFIRYLTKKFSYKPRYF